MAKRSKITNKQLQKIFAAYNNRFFNLKFDKDWRVRFEKIDPDTNAEVEYESKIIRLQPYFKVSMRVSCILLLHEMAHGSIYIDGFRNFESDHSFQFSLEINRLWKAGCYDDLL